MTVRKQKNRMKLRRNVQQSTGRPRNSEPTHRNDAGRIGALKQKLAFVRGEIIAAAGKGDLVLKGHLDTEAADLHATILRAESLIARGTPH